MFYPETLKSLGKYLLHEGSKFNASPCITWWINDALLIVILTLLKCEAVIERDNG